jgi:arylsulfatase A
LCPDSGGWSDPKPNSPEAQTLASVQLYNLAQDIGETNNVQAGHPKVVARLTKLLEKYVAAGRSTPGKRQPNTGPVEIYHTPKANPAKAKAAAAAPSRAAEKGSQ